MLHLHFVARPLWYFALLLLLPAALCAQTQAITLEDIWEKGTFQTKGGPAGIQFRKDGSSYTALKDGRVERFDLRTGNKIETLFDASMVSATADNRMAAVEDYEMSSNERKLLLGTQFQPVYRWSTQGHYFVADVNGKTVTPVGEKKPQRYATFSPDATKVAFVSENDLYIRDLANGRLTRVTSDGEINAIINGASDWVYEEEFELIRAFEWSPDSKKLAFLRFDERAVPEMTMERYEGGEYPELVKFKYPKVGEPNATVTAHIFDLAAENTIAVNTGADKEDYLPRITWTPDNRLCITRMNRHQNQVWLLLAHPTTGDVTTLLHEENKYYLDLHEPHFLANGAGLIWQSEKSGYNHLYLYDMNGKEKNALTKGNFDVTNFYGVDDKNGLVYYQTASVNAMQREVFSVNLKGKKAARISSVAGMHSAQFSGNFDYWINTYSTLNDPPRYAVRDRSGKLVRDLEQNERVRGLQKTYGTVPAEFFQVPLQYAEGQEGGPWQGFLNGFMMKPQNSAPGTKHPVLMFVYGGPGSQQVLDQWKGANYWWFQMLVQQGYMVVCVDNRGTGGRGETFKKMTYMQLGKLETLDQIAAAKHLGTLPEVDPARIGIFGWSYGGYMSSLCMLKGGETFKTGIAVAPVTNWKWYDSVYTERYMRTHEENPKGFEDNSPVNFTDQLKGQYLLVHGLADDNVHFQHSAEMSNQLIAHNKQFDAMIYPNRHHGISDKAAKMHLYRTMTQFLNKNLKGEADRP